MIGTNWANHHHLLKVTDHINGKIICANHFYLFTLSFYPVATVWAGKTNFATLPTIAYVAVNLVESLAFILVERMILSNYKDSSPHKKINKGTKELATLILEIASLVFAFIDPLRMSVVTDSEKKIIKEQVECGDGDFSQAEKITHTGALLVGTYDNFTDGDLSEFLRNLNNHMPTANENKLIFIEKTGHIQADTGSQRRSSLFPKMPDALIALLLWLICCMAAFIRRFPYYLCFQFTFFMSND